MNSIVRRIVSVILALMLLAYIGLQIGTSFYDPYQTEVVKQKSYSNTIEMAGFFVRDEIPIENQKLGVINYKFKDGQKIPKQSIIADIYNLESDIYNIRKVEKLQQEKKLYTDLQNSKNVEGSKLDFLTEQLNQNQIDLVGMVESGSFYQLSKIRDSFVSNLNRIDMSIKKNVDFQSHITGLEAEIEQVSSLISPSNEPIVSANSGYFSSTVDGLESVFTPDILSNITISEINQLMTRKQTNPNNIGKLQLDSDWRFVGIVDTVQTENITEGKTITLTFNSKTTKTISTVVEKIITEKGNNKSAVILYGNNVDADIMSMRFEKPQATISSYSGIVIPKDAIRVKTIQKEIVDEETKTKTVQDVLVKGVYVMLGKTVRFKEIDLVYEDKYVVVSKPGTNTDFVSVYDKVIIKGKDLNERG